MVDKLIASMMRRLRAPQQDQPDANLSREFLTPAPMTPLHPPAAQNDNPMAALYEAVEHDLRVAGFLR